MSERKLKLVKPAQECESSESDKKIAVFISDLMEVYSKHDLALNVGSMLGTPYMAIVDYPSGLDLSWARDRRGGW